jgi:hypothetical protein
LAPNSEKVNAMASPIPLPEPVITAVLFSSFIYPLLKNQSTKELVNPYVRYKIKNGGIQQYNKSWALNRLKRKMQFLESVSKSSTF